MAGTTPQTILQLPIAPNPLDGSEFTPIVQIVNGIQVTCKTTIEAIANAGGEGVGSGRTVSANIVSMFDSDEIVNVNFAGSVLVLAPPSPTPWRIYTVKDAGGNAYNDNIVVTPQNGGTIDGQADYTLTQNWDSVDFYTDNNGINLFTK